MTHTMQQMRAFALVFGLVPLASISAALAQSALEKLPSPPASEAMPQTDPDRRGGADSATDRRREGEEDERRFGGRFEADDDGDRRHFGRWRRDRDDAREGRWRDREDDDRMRPMMGHGRMMADHGWLMRICGPEGDRIPTFMLERLERITRPTEAQRAAFDALKNATARASEMVLAGCPAERAITPPGRLAAAEKRLDALLQAVRTVRPPMDAFYGSLTDEQKARLLMAQERPWSFDARPDRRDAGRPERRYDRMFDDDRSEPRDPSARRWRDEDDDRPRRGWR